MLKFASREIIYTIFTLFMEIDEPVKGLLIPQITHNNHF